MILLSLLSLPILIVMQKMWRITLVAFIVLIISASLFSTENKAQTSGEKVYVGITFGGTTVQEAEQLIEKVKTYANLLVVASWTIDGGPNASALTQICDYATAANMYFIVYFNFIFQNYTSNIGARYNSTTWEDYGMSPWHRPWLNEARERYGDKFLGAYLYDEPGGKQIDCGYWNKNNTTFAGTPITIYSNISSYDDVARIYVSSIARSGSMQVLTNTSYRYNLNYAVPVFVSDYALFWFDYKAGYSTVFTEIGELHETDRKIEQIALCRGAAAAQNKDWGAIITFENYNPPIPENRTTMINDMTMAYHAGAKYIIVFDYQVNGTDGLTDEQFQAMRQFWDNIHSSEANSQGKDKGQVALILPTNYGWGMRNLHDNIWGFWPADNRSAQIWDNMNKLIGQYGLNLDIVYDDSQLNSQAHYSKTYLWNETLNFSTSNPLSNETLFFAIIAGPAGVIVCVSAYFYNRRKKQSKMSMCLLENAGHQETLELSNQATTEELTTINGMATHGSGDNYLFNSFADLAEPLFDLLKSLNGYVNWAETENCLNRCRLAKAFGVKPATDNLDFRNLSQFIRLQQPQSTILETKSMIKTLFANASTPAAGICCSKSDQMEHNLINPAILAYLTLNDILLNQAIIAEGTYEERRKLAQFLQELSLRTGRNSFEEFIVELNEKRILPVDESRRSLRKQINELLSF